MPKLTRRHLRLVWYLLATLVAVLSLLINPGIQGTVLRVYVGRYWIHFLGYLALSVLPVVAWPRRTGLPLSLLLFPASIAIELARARVTAQPADTQGILVNALGILA